MSFKQLPLLVLFFVLCTSCLAQTEDEKPAELTDEQKAFPCRYGDQYKPLDFWLGEWDVFVKGKKSATSSITKSEGSCTLHENYQTATKYYGRSMNYYDPEDKKYTQIWIDKFNGILIFKEVEAKKGYLQMQADNGKGNLTKMTYVLDPKTGDVTQTMEGSKDEGKTWAVSFVGVYKKKVRLEKKAKPDKAKE